MNVLFLVGAAAARSHREPMVPPTAWVIIALLVTCLLCVVLCMVCEVPARFRGSAPAAQLPAARAAPVAPPVPVARAAAAAAAAAPKAPTPRVYTDAEVKRIRKALLRNWGEPSRRKATHV